MPRPTKIATCCYCGTRAALVLSGEVRHELACSACGAPLHNLKMLRKDRCGDRELTQRLPSRTAKPSKPRKSKSRKKRKSVFSKLVNEAFDVIEDIFD
ncbi:hypothetical protein [Sedimentitalea todarodis]|uniref:Bh protein n=1 Tax=Sedimentitalea todarodis TaxID=1631240 RepID=A0ABU3VIB2_9RHOB|nr:hypothetical protein [Sedimentitalea todarodis]MDU9005927.1 hypothetical protein [Sedimentitalea todarodis]